MTEKLPFTFTEWALARRKPSFSKVGKAIDGFSPCLLTIFINEIWQLRFFLSYKAELSGVPLHTVDPRTTSRTCHVCGHCAKENRKSQACFCCVKCGYTDNADRNAAINISRAAPSCSLLSRPVVDLDNQISA